MPLPVIIIHGWSDHAVSFERVADFLEEQGMQVVDLWLGDYISMRDRVTLWDIGFAMRRALAAKGIPQDRYSFDVVIHSTGALVVREYLRQVCGADASLTPVRNLVMLAPANFGSPLAKVGKSVIGRLFKGWSWEKDDERAGETGERILDALEMASPYSWQLAHEDLVGERAGLFTPRNCRCTVMVGTSKYGGLRGITHVAGGDGTVLVSTANLNVRSYLVDFATPDHPAFVHAPKGNPSAIAFAVFDRNHGTITHPVEDDESLAQIDEWQTVFLAALRVTEAGYAAHVDACNKQTARTFADGRGDNFHQYMHVVFKVRDQFGQPIPDYVIDFYQSEGDDRDKVYRKIHGEVLEKIWPNTKDASYRSFLLDLTDLEAFLKKNPKAVVELSVAAAPVSRDISYRNPSQPARGVPVFGGANRAFWHANQTAMVEMILHREPADAVFTLRNASPGPTP